MLFTRSLTIFGVVYNRVVEHFGNEAKRPGHEFALLAAIQERDPKHAADFDFAVGGRFSTGQTSLPLCVRTFRQRSPDHLTLHG